MRRPSRKVLTIILVAILAVTFLEVYAHSYVKIDNLTVVNSEYALNVPQWINGSLTFSSNGAKWLVLITLPEFTEQSVAPTENTALRIFKISQNSSLFSQSIDVNLIKVDINSNPEGVHISSPTNALNNGATNLVSSSKYIDASVDYFQSAGTYNVKFTFTFRVYETTMFGIFPLNETTVSFSKEMTVLA